MKREGFQPLKSKAGKKQRNSAENKNRKELKHSEKRWKEENFYYFSLSLRPLDT